MEFEILYGLQQLHHPVLDFLMVQITRLGNGGILWIVVAAVMLKSEKTRRCGKLILVSMAICYLLGNLWMKNLFERQRPCWLDPSVTLLIPSPEDFSFPSGHTLHSFTAAVMIFLHEKKAGTIALILAAFIAFSRMYLFVHFPTDILAGLLLGTAAAAAVYFGAGKLFPTGRGKTLSGKMDKDISL